MKKKDMYKYAAKQSLRYDTARGTLNTEDLFGLSLADLDVLAKSLNRQIKEADEESFIKPVTANTMPLKVSFEIVKDVIATKIADQEAAEKRIETRKKKQRIMELIAQKQDEALSDKSEEDLKKMLDEL